MRDAAGRWLLAGLLSAIPGCYQGIELQPGVGDDDANDDTGRDDAGGTDDGGAGTGDDMPDDGVPAECGDGMAPRGALVRMSRTNYVNALEEIFGPTVVEEVDGALSSLPSTHVGVFSAELAAPTYSEISAQVFIASQLAYELTRDDAALTALMPCLSSVPSGADPLDDTCLADFLDAYGKRILRRPLTDSDRERLAGDYAVGGAHSVNEGVATLLIALLIDPEFLYFVETRGEEIAPGVIELTPYETAAKLARVLWSSIPDEELLAAADAGLEGDVLDQQVERMLEDDRARAAVGSFYRDWLELEALPFPSEALFPDPAVRTEVRDAMQQELLSFVEATTLDHDGTYADLLLDRRTSLESPALAQLYGVSPGADITLPDDDRAGLLTRAAFLATPEIRGTNAGHIIKRGDRVSKLICRPLPLPDPDSFPQADPADPESDPEQGIRDRFAAATAEPQCASCHVQLDGLGAPLGNFGSSGQWITNETIELSSGATTELPIDTTSEIFLDDGPVAVADAVALSEAIAASDVGVHCFAQQLTRSIVARPLEPSDDCMVGAAAEALAPAEGEPLSIREALIQLVTSDHFRRNAVQ